MVVTSKLAGLQGQKYLNLETYRKNGVGVRTPVWFAISPEDTKLYVYTTADSGKAKRIRRTDRVKLAPCDMRGKVTGAWIDARADIVSGAEYGAGMKLLNRKYWPWKQILDLSVVFMRRHERIMLVIRAV